MEFRAKISEDSFAFFPSEKQRQQPALSGGLFPFYKMDTSSDLDVAVCKDIQPVDQKITSQIRTSRSELGIQNILNESSTICLFSDGTNW